MSNTVFYIACIFVGIIIWRVGSFLYKYWKAGQHSRKITEAEQVLIAAMGSDSVAEVFLGAEGSQEKFMELGQDALWEAGHELTTAAISNKSILMPAARILNVVCAMTVAASQKDISQQLAQELDKITNALEQKQSEENQNDE